MGVSGRGIISEVLSQELAQWISGRAGVMVALKSKYCVINALHFLEQAEKLSSTSPRASYFLATHAAEEAVAAVICAAVEKDFYKAQASQIKANNHRHKAIVYEFAQVASVVASNLGMKIAVHPDKGSLLASIIDGGQARIVPLGLGLVSFNSGTQSEETIGAETFFRANRSDAEVFSEIEVRATFRNKLLYASDLGLANMSDETLQAHLKDTTLITLGLIWAAYDVSRHETEQAFVSQTLGALIRLSKVKAPKADISNHLSQDRAV